jgi:hypothetical protein
MGFIAARDGDVHAFGDERAGDGEADAARSAGDDGHAAAK